MDEYLKVEDVAKKLKVKPVTIQRWCRSGKLRSKKIGKNWYIYNDEFEDEKKDTIKTKLDLEQAFDNVRQDMNWDLVTDIINYKDYLHCKKEIIKDLNKGLTLEYKPKKIELIDIHGFGFPRIIGSSIRVNPLLNFTHWGNHSNAKDNWLHWAHPKAVHRVITEHDLFKITNLVRYKHE